MRRSFGVNAVLLAILTGPALSGCSLFEYSKSKPVLEDTIGVFGFGPVSTIAVSPERRIAFVNTRRGGNRYGYFCAEPPPDVAESISAQVQAALEAAVQSGNATPAEVAVVGNIGSQLSTSVMALAARSQGVMLFRDGGFRFCELYANEQIDKGEYLKLLNSLLERSHDLIKHELTSNVGKIGHGPLLALDAPQIEQLEGVFLRSMGVDKADTAAKPDMTPGGIAGRALDRLDDPRRLAPGALAGEIEIDQAERRLAARDFASALLANDAAQAAVIKAAVKPEEATALAGRADAVLKSCPANDATEIKTWQDALAKNLADDATSRALQLGMTCPPA